jgi:hypothetical protein
LYWRVLADHTRATSSASKVDEAIEALMCNTVVVCEMLASPRLNLKATAADATAAFNASVAASQAAPLAAAVLSPTTILFVRSQLLKLTQHLDLQDEMGSGRLTSWIQNELRDVASPHDQVLNEMFGIVF